MSEALFQDGELAHHPDWIERTAFECYNASAAAVGWPQTANLTESRAKRLRRAVRDCGGMAGWKMALARAERSDFLTGKLPPRFGRKVGANVKLDWFLFSPRLTALLDGEYDNAPAAPGTCRASVHKRAAAAAAQVPPKELPFVPEPRSERLRASIEILRKHGKWAMANRREEELAAIEKRSPVLVPAPDVARLGEEWKQSGEERPRAAGPMVFDAETGARQSPADIERERRMAFEAANTPPEWDGEPVGPYAVEGPED